MIRIRAFRASSEPETCEKFIAGHRSILEMYYGIIKVTSDNNNWVHDPDCIVVIAEDTHTLKVLGGARLQIASGYDQLPIESALSKYDKKIYQLIEDSNKCGFTSEICGLWNSKEIAGMGIGSHILVRVCIAISPYVNVKSIFALCAPATVKISTQKGFKIVTEIGNNGTFFYPKDNFIATIMKLSNVNDLNSLLENEKLKIITLRENLNYLSTEKGPKGTFEVEYMLDIRNNKYESVF